MLAYGALVRSRRSWALQYISRAEGVRAHEAHLLSPTTTAELKDGARQALRDRAHDYVQVAVGDDLEAASCGPRGAPWAQHPLSCCASSYCEERER